MRAFSVPLPYAELILRGVKTIEYRSRPTRIIGERFHIYASKGNGASFGGPGVGRRMAVPLAGVGSGKGSRVWSRELGNPEPPPPAWMLELAHGLILGELPVGVIVGSAIIEKVTPPAASDPHGLFHWHLADVQRAKTLRKPRGHPQPVWFTPF